MEGAVFLLTRVPVPVAGLALAILVSIECIVSTDKQINSLTSLMPLLSNCIADINECASNNGGCAGTCHNTAGSYYCTCPSGCTLGSDGHSCNGELQEHVLGHELCIEHKKIRIIIFSLDINECSASTDNCDHNCHNNGNCGGFYCSCNTGYALASNGYSCNG